MKTTLNVDGLMLIGLGVGVPVLGFIGYKLYGAKEAVGAALDKVNPASSNNFVNQGVESLGQAITGDENFTLGGWAFDITHGDDGQANYLTPLMTFTDFLNPVGVAKQVGSMAIKAAPYVNPANPNNLVNQAVTKVVGEKNVATAADKVFGLMDLMNPFNESDAYAKIIWGL